MQIRNSELKHRSKALTAILEGKRNAQCGCPCGQMHVDRCVLTELGFRVQRGTIKRAPMLVFNELKGEGGNVLVVHCACAELGQHWGPPIEDRDVRGTMEKERAHHVTSPSTIVHWHTHSICCHSLMTIICHALLMGCRGGS